MNRKLFAVAVITIVGLLPVLALAEDCVSDKVTLINQHTGNKVLYKCYNCVNGVFQEPPAESDGGEEVDGTKYVYYGIRDCLDVTINTVPDFCPDKNETTGETDVREGILGKVLTVDNKKGVYMFLCEASLDSTEATGKLCGTIEECCGDSECTDEEAINNCYSTGSTSDGFEHKCLKATAGGETPEKETECGDGACCYNQKNDDNDYDGQSPLTDCKDPDCDNVKVTVNGVEKECEHQTETFCTDEFDNDGDGHTDCGVSSSTKDPDCDCPDQPSPIITAPALVGQPATIGIENCNFGILITKIKYDVKPQSVSVKVLKATTYTTPALEGAGTIFAHSICLRPTISSQKTTFPISAQ
ncbi:hypothetical protein A3K63_03455 [Candidatus Micrarchaeota archaeon RBG_16_49_10]|nr:MAG: hypothetical protein A3K63_03455 [Candidatus Micrarchaeota archaeon RBG_16_49_10]